MRILSLGGAGMLGSAFAREARAHGHGVTVTTRDSATERGIPSGAEHLVVDVRDRSALEEALRDRTFDAVVNWIGFTAEEVEWHPEFFADRVSQYVFISTCVVYSRPVALLPITEASPRGQQDLEYGRNKIAAELVFERAFRESRFPVTIVRPSHTYDETSMPLVGGWTVIDRMRRGLPVVVHGDGTSLWALMHSRDFAAALLPIIGNVRAIGGPVNVVSNEILNWEQIHEALAVAAGVAHPILVHRSSETIAREIPDWELPLRDEFRHSLVFDTTRLSRLSPDFRPSTSFSRGAREIIAWRDADESRREVDNDISSAFDRLIAQ